MSQYVTKRIPTIVPVPIGVSVIVFGFTNLIPRMTRASLLEALSHSERTGVRHRGERAWGQRPLGRPVAQE